MTRSRGSGIDMKIGVYSITGCMGCLLSIIFNEKDLLELNDKVEIAAFPFIKDNEEVSFFRYINTEIKHKQNLLYGFVLVLSNTAGLKTSCAKSNAI